MPSQSPAQHRLMEAVAHNPKFAKHVGIPVSVGQDFAAADKAKKLADGGSVNDGSRVRAQAHAPPFSSIFGGLADMLSGAARGAAKTTLGWPGDLERLLGEQLPEVAGSYRSGAPLAWNLRSAREAMERTKDAPTVLPTGEDVGRWLPEATRFTPGPNPYETLGANAMLTPSQLGRGVARGVKAGAGALGSLADTALSPVPRRLSQLGAVRVKGGNFDTPQLESYLRDFHTWEPEAPDARLMSLAGVAPGELGPPRETMINQWLDKQMKNYISKDLGSPTDPLLQVEKEYPNLHLPEGEVGEAQAGLDELMSNAAWGRQGRLGKYQVAADRLNTHEALSGGAPMTPWGWNADMALVSSSPARFSRTLAGRNEAVPAWLDKAPPETKIWGMHPQVAASAGDPLGIGHIRDYLDAATQAHELTADEGANALNRMVPPIQREPRMNRALALHQAGLTLDPQSLGRLSVADAVRKTAQWNEHLATAGVAGDPDLARGIKQVVKEYPDSGHRWVELGHQTPTSELPPGYTMFEHPNWQERNIHRYGVKHTESGAVAGAEGDTPENVIGQAWAMRNHDDLAAGLNAEGNAMGHCVGGYCDDVASRGTKIFSLRDAAGAPHVTVEVAPSRQYASTGMEDFDENDRIAAIRKMLTTPAERGQFTRELNQAIDDGDVTDLLTNSAWSQRLPVDKSTVGDIVQIKGKQNAAPVDKYLPMVQDFVKNHGPWGRVGDLQNTGLSFIDKDHPLTTGMNSFAYKLDPGYYTQDDLIKAMSEQGVSPETARDSAANYWQGSWKPNPANYAQGGSVQAPRFARHFKGAR